MTGRPDPIVRLPRPIAEAIVEHARASRPNEACGLIAGSGRVADGGRPLRYLRCRNAAASPSRYVMDRDDLLQALDELDQAGEELWGVVHSHVRTPAVPSETDRREAAWPAAVQMLVSLAGDAESAAAGDAMPTSAPAPALPSLRAWRIVDGSAEELVLEIGDALPAEAER